MLCASPGVAGWSKGRGKEQGRGGCSSSITLFLVTSIDTNITEQGVQGDKTRTGHWVTLRWVLN